jgi:hypothetical protein
MISRLELEVNHSPFAACTARRDLSVVHPTCHNLPVCGRYRLSRRKQNVEEHSGDEDWKPRYNIAPTQPVPIIRQHPMEMTLNSRQIREAS